MADDNIAVDPIDESVDENDEGEGAVVGVEKDLTGDGGVVKKILVEGSGWQTPAKGDEVEVHYVGTLEDGTEFDSSRGRGDPFSFKLGVGSVIKAWDRGVATMKKGEKAVLICRGDYAYGASGSPPKIPPNATLHFEVELLSWHNSNDISPSQDGALLKTVTTEGEGWANPSGRDEVLVRYVARVEGADDPFATSPEEGHEFALSSGHLLPALPIAVATMKKGEKATLIVQPSLGFGDAGQPPAVPPGAVLKVELELLSWKKLEDLTGNGAVVKKTLSEGKDTWKKPNDGATVTLRYTGRLADGTVFEQQDAKTFCLEDGELPPGLELAVSKMHLGERALVSLAATHAFGEAGRAEGLKAEGLLADVPPGSAVTYEVELSSLENAKELWDLTKEEDKLSTCLAVKEKGNAAFKAGHNARAVKLYKRAVQYVEVDKTKTTADEFKAPFKDARKSCLLNLAAAQIKLSQWKEAVQSCEKVLEVDSGSIKALYRLAQAWLGDADFVEAERAIKRGLLVEERNADLLALQKKLKAQAREFNQRESKIFAKMFAPRPDPPAEAVAVKPSEEKAAAAAAPLDEEAAAAGVSTEQDASPVDAVADVPAFTEEATEAAAEPEPAAAASAAAAEVEESGDTDMAPQ